MRLSTPVGLALGATAALALLAACSGGGSGITGAAPSVGGAPAQSTMHRPVRALANSAIVPRALWPRGHAYVLHARPEAHIGQIFASRANVSAVNAYQRGTGPNNPLEFELGGALNLPQGMTTDRSGALYIANTASSQVLVYARGSQTPTKTLTVTGYEPADVAVAPNGTTYTANIVSNADGAGDVTVFAPGAITPTKTLTDTNFNQVIGVALDATGTLYVSYGDTNNVGHVAYYPPGKTKAIETGISLGFPGGVAFDGSGNLLVSDQFSGMIDVYKPGNPTAIAQLAIPGDAAYFALDKTSSRLYVSDFETNAVEVFDYTPTALTLTNTITNDINQYDNVLGIAVTPAQKL